MKIAFERRDVVGKGVASLREQGMTPVVCYGKKEASNPYSVKTQFLKKFLASGEVVIETDGDLSDKQVILQDIAVHPVSGMPLHADFLFVDAEHEVEHEVPVQVVGEAPGVKVEGGQMIIALDRIAIRALPHNIPTHIHVDISQLEHVGSHLLVSDLVVPDGVTLVTSPDEIVISIVEQSQEEEEQMPDETYMENIEVTGKGGKKEDAAAENEETGV